MPASELKAFMQAVKLAHKHASKGKQGFPKACADTVLTVVKKSIVWHATNSTTTHTLGEISYSVKTYTDPILVFDES